MPIDIHFLQRFPEAFFNQDTPNGDANFFRLLRNADTNHDFQLSAQELQAMDPAMASPANQESLYRTCAFIDETLRSGRLDIRNNPPNFSLFSPRHVPVSTHYSVANPIFDRDQNHQIDRSEILTYLAHSINPRVELLEARLRRTAEGLYRMENNPEHRGLMNLLNFATWIPFRIIPGISANTLHEQIHAEAGRRHEIRLTAVDRLVTHLRSHPDASVQNALASLSAQERTILTEDLQLENSQHLLAASTPEHIIDAHLDMAESLMVGRESNYILGGIKTLDEFFTVPLRSENYAAAEDIMALLEEAPVNSQLNPEQRARLSRLRLDSASGNQEIIRNLPVAHDRTQSAINSLVRGALGLVDLPRNKSINEGWDFSMSVVIELFLLKGGLKALKLGRAALATRLSPLWNSLWSSFAARLAPQVAPRVLALTGGQVIAAGGVASTGTALCSNGNCASSGATALGTCGQIMQRASSQVSQGFFSILGGIVRGAGSVLGFGVTTVSVTAGTALATNVLIPPERHYTQTRPLSLPDADLQNPWVDANLASLALALYTH